MSNPDLLEINQRLKIPVFEYGSGIGQKITVIDRPNKPLQSTRSIVASIQKTSLQTVFVVPPLSPVASNSSASLAILPTTSIQQNTEVNASQPVGVSKQGNLPVLFRTVS